MSKQTITNLTREQQPHERICTVVKSLGGGLYQLRDLRGRTLTARSTSTWQPTQGVIVAGGVITGAAESPKNITIIEV